QSAICGGELGLLLAPTVLVELLVARQVSWSRRALIGFAVTFLIALAAGFAAGVQISYTKSYLATGSLDAALTGAANEMTYIRAHASKTLELIGPSVITVAALTAVRSATDRLRV